VTLANRLVDIAPYPAVRAYQLLLVARHDALLHAIDGSVRPGDVALDIGAYRGWYADRLASRVGPQGRVHAVEPNPDAIRALSAVARHHGQIRVHAVAASNKSGHGQLQRPYVAERRVDAMGSLSNPVVDGLRHDTVDVRLETVDQLLHDEVGRVTFIKCDVEGHEQEVLEGATHLIEQSRPVIVVEIEQRHRGRPIEETFSWLAERGYQGQYVVRNEVRPLSEFDLFRDQLQYVTTPLYAGRPHRDYVSDFLFFPR